MAVGTMCSNMPSWFKLAAIIGLLVVFVLDMIVSALSNTEIGKESGVFPNTTAEIAHKYDTVITPTDSTFGIWGFIYSYVLLAIGYSLSTICRKGKAGKGIYDDPEVMPPSFYLAFSLNLALTVAWLVVWSHQYITAAMALILASVVLIVISLQQLCAQLEAAGAALVAQGYANDIWYVRFFVQNMASTFLSWLTVAGLISVVTVVVYAHGQDMALCSFVAVCTLIAVVTSWFGLETFVYDRSLRYVFTQYPVYITALSGIIQRHYDPQDRVSIAVATALAVVCFLFLIKIILVIYKSIRDPIVYVKEGAGKAYEPLSKSKSG